MKLNFVLKKKKKIKPQAHLDFIQSYKMTITFRIQGFHMVIKTYKTYFVLLVGEDHVNDLTRGLNIFFIARIDIINEKCLNKTIPCSFF